MVLTYFMMNKINQDNDTMIDEKKYHTGENQTLDCNTNSIVGEEYD